MRGSEDKVETPFTTVNRYPMPLGFNSKGRAALYRWFSGRPLNGHRYTNATAFRYGTRSLDVSGHATSYQLLPGYLRFLYVRLPIMMVPPVALATLLWPMFMYYFGLAMVLLATWRIQVWRKRAAFRRDVIEPVSAGASAVLMTARVAGQGHAWVDVPRDFRDNPDAKIKLDLPLAWIGRDGDKAQLVKIVAAKLNMDELTPMWSLHGGNPSVTFSVPPAPPDEVLFRDSLDDADRVEDSSLMMGYGPRSRMEVMSLLLESPHFLINGGSGAGKSVFLAWLVVQFMRRGFGVLVLDAKFVSHLWLNRVPGVHYASEAKDLHEALVWLDGELLRRARFVQKAADTAAASASLTPLVVVLEEINAATNRLRAYWKSIKGPDDPALSPALTALANLANMGRELMVHILLAGQSVTARATGGPEGRESFGARALGRATSNAWRMLAPQIKPAPVRRGRPGRWHLVVGDTLREFQVPFLDLKNAAAMAAVTLWACSGRPVPDVSAMIAGWVDEEASAPVETPSSEPVTTLSDYAKKHGLNVATLRQWVNRHGHDWGLQQRGTGAKNAALYAVVDLDGFVAGRLREPAGADPAD